MRKLYLKRRSLIHLYFTLKRKNTDFKSSAHRNRKYQYKRQQHSHSHFSLQRREPRFIKIARLLKRLARTLCTLRSNCVKTALTARSRTNVSVSFRAGIMEDYMALVAF